MCYSPTMNWSNGMDLESLKQVVKGSNGKDLESLK
jgi:hypothetical protein